MHAVPDGTAFANETTPVRVSSVVLALWLLSASVGQAQAPVRARYVDVAAARKRARLAGATHEDAVAFERVSSAYLEKHPGHRFVSRVLEWRGDLLQDYLPDVAYECYLEASRQTDNKDRRAQRLDKARQMLFVREGPPPLQAAAWAGNPQDPAAPADTVTLVVFYSPWEPEGRKVQNQLVDLHEQYSNRGLRLIGVAVPMDKRRRDPQKAARRIAADRLPFCVAVDKQDRKGNGVTYKAYGAGGTPWGLFVDRMGRVRERRLIGPGPNPLVLTRTRIKALLDEPGPDEVLRRLRLGGTVAQEALREMDTLRTRTAVNILFAALQAKLGTAEQKRVTAILRKTLPLELRTLDLKAAHKRWKRSRSQFRYSLPKHCQVRRR